MPTTLTTLVAMFTQPGGASNFFDTVVSKKVSLENAYMETSSSIGGIVRVLNIDYHKSVTVRWTVNDWSTFTEVGATYVPGSSDGFSDKFSFRLGVGSLPIGSRIQFCLRYNSSGAEFWDSNNGANYVFQVCRYLVCYLGFAIRLPCEILFKRLKAQSVLLEGGFM